MAFEPCRIKNYAHEIECQTIKVEDKLIVVHRVKSAVRYPVKEPLVWIPNGLAVNVGEVAASKIRRLKRVRAYQDFIWLKIFDTDQQSWMRCSDSNKYAFKKNPILFRIDRFADEPYLAKCLQNLKAENIDEFSSAKLASYYEFVRKALGYKQVVLHAEGLGAQVAFSWFKQAPDAIAFQVLDSAVPLKSALFESSNELQARFNRVISRCDKNSACLQKYGNGHQHFKQILARLPVATNVYNPLSGELSKLEITSDLFNTMMGQLLRSSLLSTQIPKVLFNASSDNWQIPINLLALGWSKHPSSIKGAAYLAQYCLLYKSEITNDTTDSPSWFYTMAKARVDRLCSGLGLVSKTSVNEDLDPTPTLLLSSNVTGTLSKWSFLPNRTHINVANASGSLLGYGCAKDVMYRYFKARRRNPSLPKVRLKSLEASCLTQIPLPELDVSN